MSLLQAYLRSPRTQRALSRKPGEKGFSLIELVVVVAVLAILSAIAIPSFTSISEKARAAAASNTLAQIAKECATKIADAGTGDYAIPSLDGYRPGATTTIGWYEATNATPPVRTYHTSGRRTCPTTGSIGLGSSDTSKYPTFEYNVENGSKVCTASSTALTRGCPVSGGPW